MDKDEFELPKMNESKTEPVKEEEGQAENKPIIEIPKEYYDKLEKEAAEKEAAKKEAERKEEENNRLNAATNKIMTGAFFNAIIFILLLYFMTKKNILIIIGFPIYIILFSIINKPKKDQEPSAPMSTLIGGLIAAGLSYLGTMFFKEELLDFFNYSTLASLAVAMVGMIISSIVTTMIVKKEETKALGTIFYLLIFVVLFGGSYLAYQKFPEQVLKYVFNQKNTIIAESEDEFIIKTLKNRYGIDFNCDGEKLRLVDEKNIRITQVTCTDSKGVEFVVRSVEHSVASVEYAVADSYANVVYINPLAKKLEEELQLVTGATKVHVALYPKEYCFFIGECVATDEYYENYEKETSVENRYQFSRNLDMKKYVGLTPQEFVNQYGLGYSIVLYGNYEALVDTRFEETVNSILNTLNTSGYQNKNGYIITFKNDSAYKEKIYTAVGKASSDGKFKNPTVK